MEGFISLLEAIDGVVWGPIMLTVLVGTGIYLTIRHTVPVLEKSRTCHRQHDLQRGKTDKGRR